MNRSYSKIRHIQEANARLEKRVIKEDFESSIKRRIPSLEELIDFEINDNSSDDFKDEFEYASNIINWVTDAFIQLPENSKYENEYDDIVNYLKDNYGEMIMSHYEEGNDEWDEEGDDDDEWDEDNDEWDHRFFFNEK
jgi:hypothetical protein